MPIHQSLWRLADTAERLPTAQLQTVGEHDFLLLTSTITYCRTSARHVAKYCAIGKPPTIPRLTPAMWWAIQLPFSYGC